MFLTEAEKEEEEKEFSSWVRLLSKTSVSLACVSPNFVEVSI
jgi:hypothetical protein